MITPFLPGTVRALSLHYASTQAHLSVASVVHPKQYSVQSSHIQQGKLTAQVRKAIAKTLGHVKPKQPLPPYFRFMQQIRSSVVAEYPHLKANELYPVITERWKSLEAEEKKMLSSAYRNDMRKYSEEITNYISTISVDDKLKLKEKLDEISARKLIRLYRKRARELNKPKKPPNSFLRFFHEQTDRQPNETYKDFMKRMSSRWQTLSATKKKKYEPKPEEMDNYRNAMLAWEATVQRSIDDKGDDMDKGRANVVDNGMRNFIEGLDDNEYVDEDEFDEDDV